MYIALVTVLSDTYKPVSSTKQKVSPSARQTVTKSSPCMQFIYLGYRGETQITWHLCSFWRGSRSRVVGRHECVVNAGYGTIEQLLNVCSSSSFRPTAQWSGSTKYVITAAGRSDHSQMSGVIIQRGLRGLGGQSLLVHSEVIIFYTSPWRL